MVASLLLLSWVWALALAAQPEWLAWAHGVSHANCEHHEGHDADESDHACAATLIATGAFSVTHAPPIRVAGPMVLAGLVWPWRSSDAVTSVRVGESLEPGEKEVREVLPKSDLRTEGLSGGASSVWDDGYFGLASSGFHTNSGTVAEPDVTIDREQRRWDFRGAFLGRFAGVKAIEYHACTRPCSRTSPRWVGAASSRG